MILVQNFDVSLGIVNGTEGILRSVRYVLDEKNVRHARSCIVYVEELNVEPLPGLQHGKIVALEHSVTIKVRHPIMKKTLSFKRKQIPILPVFVLTDYKAQGKTMKQVIVDIESCHGSQSPYVMLLRATSLNGLRILRPFDRSKLQCHLSQSLRKEEARLRKLFRSTQQLFSMATEPHESGNAEDTVTNQIVQTTIQC